MKLSDYLPEVPVMAQQMSELNSQINTLELMKASGDTASSPSFGLDHVVNTWVRHQMAYRQQLVMDIQTISMSVEVVRAPVSHITGEVFRRGIEWKAKVQDPDPEQRERMEKVLSSCSVFDQSLEEVLRQFHFDVNIVDDGFLYLVKEFYDDGKTVRSKVKEVRRLNPALVEYDLDMAGLKMLTLYVLFIERKYQIPQVLVKKVVVNGNDGLSCISIIIVANTSIYLRVKLSMFLSSSLQKRMAGVRF